MSEVLVCEERGCPFRVDPASLPWRAHGRPASRASSRLFHHFLKRHSDPLIAKSKGWASRLARYRRRMKDYRQKSVFKCDEEGCGKLISSGPRTHFFNHFLRQHTDTSGSRARASALLSLLASRRGSRSTKVFACDECGLELHSSGELFNHVAVRHAAEGSSLRAQRRHGIDKKRTKCMVCDLCGHQGFDTTNMVHHIQGHGLESREVARYVPRTLKKPIRCDDCQKTMTTQIAVTSHFSRHLQRVEKHKHRPTKKLTCDANECSLSFPDRRCLVAHLIQRHQLLTAPPKQTIRSFRQSCDSCGRVFASYTSMTKHLESAVGLGQRVGGRLVCPPPPHRREGACCDECGESFARKSHSLFGHFVRSHADRCLPSWSALLRGDRGYERAPYRRYKLSCEECGRSSTGRRSLRNHLVEFHRHSLPANPRNYACDREGRRFSQLSALLFHIARNHGGDIPKNLQTELASNERKRPVPVALGVLCDDCEKTFRDLQSLKRHRKNGHQSSPE